MVYKRYILKKGKKFGPYYYESYRDENGITRTRCVSKPQKSKKYLAFLLGIFGLLLIGFLITQQISESTFSETDIESDVSEFRDAVKQEIENEEIKTKPISEESGIKEFYNEIVSPVTKKFYSFLTGFVVDANETIEEEEILEEEAEEEAEILEETLEEEEEIMEEVLENETISETEVLNETIIPEGIVNETEIVNATDEIEIVIANETEVPETEILNETEVLDNETIIPEDIVNETEIAETEIVIANETAEVTNETKEVLAQISVNHFGAVIGKPVRWEKNVKIVEANKVQNLTIKLPVLAGNISVKKINKSTGEKQELEIEIEKEKIIREIEPIVKTGGIVQTSLSMLVRIAGRVIEVIETEEEVVVEINEEIDEGDEFVVEYYTDAPYSEEQDVGGNKKKITVIGPDEVHYENILAFSELPFELSNYENVNLYHLANGTKQEVMFELYDSNNNSLYDYVSWIVPHLSEQEYELEITVLNVQSYPDVGGNWVVEFTTVGKANLTIKAIDGTTWSNENENEDLKFLEVRCGEQVLSYVWDEGVFIADYECNETGFEVSKVLTSGKHHLEFDFGGQKAYANNDAGNPSNIPQTLNLHGKLTDENDVVLSGTHNMTFKIYDAATGGSLLWEVANQSVSVDSEGVYHAILSAVNLSFAEPTYLGISVGTDAEMTPRINMSSTPYAFRANTADVLNSDNNYTMSALNISENLGVAGNITASYFKGDGSLLTGISGLDNSSWNESYADGLYAPNTTAGIQSLINSTGVYSTYNATYDALVTSNSSWNQTVVVDNYVPYTGADKNIVLGANNFSVDSSVLFVDSGNNRVGIGTTTPGESLTISNTADVQIRMGHSADISQYAYNVGRNGTNGLLQFYGLHTGYTGYIFDGVDGERMRIDSSGNVGIGTTSPSQKLDVRGVGNFSGTIYINNNTDISTFGVDTNASTICSGTTTYLDGEGDCDDIINVYINEAGDDTGNLSADLNIDSDTFVISYDDNKVGIGTAGPSAKLNVEATGSNQGLHVKTAAVDTTAYLQISMENSNNVGMYRIGSNANGMFNINYDETTDSGGTDGNTILVINGTSENVGIGTTNILAKLQITNTGTGKGVRINQEGVSATGDAGFYVYSNAEQVNAELVKIFQDHQGSTEDVFHIENDGTGKGLFVNQDGAGTALYIENKGGSYSLIVDGGNVGIGDTTPGEKLEVDGNINVTAGNDVCITGGNCLSSVAMANSAAGWTNTSATTSTSLDVNLTTGNLTIANGRVGIGTGSPSTPLHVKRSTTGDSTILTLDTPDSSSDTNLSLDFAQMGTPVGRIKSVYESNGNLGLALSSYGGSLTEKVRISADGNVGIGTTSSGAKLDVQGGAFRVHNTGAVTSTIEFERTSDNWTLGSIELDHAGSYGSNMNFKLHPNDGTLATSPVSVMYLKSDGNVGIGTTTPSAKLEVAGDINSTGDIYAGINDQFVLDRGGRASHARIEFRNASTLQWTTGLQGNVDSTTFTIREGGGNDILAVTSSGNVGIGTTAPTHELNVVGDINATGSIYKNGGTAVDFVFDKYFDGEVKPEDKKIAEDYELIPLEELENYVKKYRHLPRLNKEIYTQQYEIGEMDNRLLEKIEELTLYTIEQQRQIEMLNQRLQILEIQN